MNLSDEIKKQCGVDVDALAAEHLTLGGSGVLEKHNKNIDALFTTILLCSRLAMLKESHGAARTLFLLGYQAGLDAPDLSAFAGVLEDGES